MDPGCVMCQKLGECDSCVCMGCGGTRCEGPADYTPSSWTAEICTWVDVFWRAGCEDEVKTRGLAELAGVWAHSATEVDVSNGQLPLTPISADPTRHGDGGAQ